jgi:type 1 glutamine amidotransferase
MAATSHQIADILAGAVLPCPKGGESDVSSGDCEVGSGAQVVVRSTFRGALDDLADFDLLVLNISRAEPGYREAEIDGTEEYWTPFISRIADWANSGGRVLALHAATLAAGDYPELESVIGGAWVEGVSGHPPIGDMTLTIPNPSSDSQEWQLPGAVQAFDERYCRLRVSPEVEVLGWVRDDPEPGQSEGTAYPALWFHRPQVGQQNPQAGMVVYSALGHDARSFASPSHQELLVKAARHLLSR